MCDNMFGTKLHLAQLCLYCPSWRITIANQPLSTIVSYLMSHLDCTRKVDTKKDDEFLYSYTIGTHHVYVQYMYILCIFVFQLLCGYIG